MKPIVLPALVAALLAVPAAAQAQYNDPEDRMLLEGAPPTPGANVPSDPQNIYSNPGLEIGTVTDGGTAAVGGSAAGWVGLPVVDRQGRQIGEVQEVLGQGEAVIVARPDGSVQTVSSAALTSDGARLVADGSALR